MFRWRWLLVFLGLALLGSDVQASALLGRNHLRRLNRRLHGQVLDFTANHGHDHRIWSSALCQRRDVYVYLPPGYSPEKRYPLGIFLHGAGQDEHFFLDKPVELFDKAIVNGELLPVVIVAPDGSILGRPSFFNLASWWANSRAGNFEDYLMQDVWNFAMDNFAICPQREAHALVGVSMGGSAAFAHAMKYKDRVGICVGFMPALNLRWLDCHGQYESKFDPFCWGWREEATPLQVMGRPGWGLVKIRYGNFFGPTFGRTGPESVAELSRNNPIEIMDRVNLQDRELELYVAYGGKDEFRFDAQVESFLYVAQRRGITIAVDYDPNGHHDVASGVRHFPPAIRWVAPRLAGFRQIDKPVPLGSAEP